MKKQNKTVLMIIIAIILALGVFLLINKGSMDEKNKARADEVFNITAGGKENLVTMEMLEKIGMSKVEADYKKSGKAPVKKMYEGVPFARIVKEMNIDTKGADSVVFTASDGYTSAVSLEEAMDKDNCFIAVKVDGEKIENGPYMMLLAKDKFSQRWCSYLLDVVIQ